MASISFFSSSIFFSSPKPTSSSSSPKFYPHPLKTLTLGPETPAPISCKLATLPVISFAGEQIGETFLDLKTARPETARAVVHRAILTDLQNKRRGTASTLTRGEVRGGGKKPYPQKKTGRARRGSQRTPLRPGGGVVFGPKPRDWSIKINKKEKRLAMSTAIMSAAVNSFVVEDFADRFSRPRTKDFIETLKRWGIDPKEKSMFMFTGEVAENVKLSGRNIGTVRMLTPRTLNLFDILNADHLIYSQSAIDYLNGMYGVSAPQPELEEEEEEEEEYNDEEEEEGEFQEQEEDQTSGTTE